MKTSLFLKDSFRIKMTAQYIFCLLIFTTILIPIKSVPQCDDISMHQSCCFPKRILEKHSEACPEKFVILMNNSKVTCSEKGDMKDISSIHDTYSDEPFCSKTCPDDFQVLVNKSISLCMQCEGGCEFNVLARYVNDTKNDDSKESHKATIAIILSAIAITFCAIGTAIYCFLKKRRRCQQSQARSRKSDHVKAVTESPIYENTKLDVPSKQETFRNEKKVQTGSYENVQIATKKERMGNYYGKDPTTNPKTVIGRTEDLEGTIEISDGIQNNGYDTIDESTDEFSKEHNELPEDGKQYENMENKHRLYENQPISDYFNNDENLQNKNSGETLIESSAGNNINAVNTNKVILGSCEKLTAVRTESLTVGQLEHLTLNIQNVLSLQINDSKMHTEKDNTIIF